jgi:hypothetical protein
MVVLEAFFRIIGALVLWVLLCIIGCTILLLHMLENAVKGSK